MMRKVVLALCLLSTALAADDRNPISDVEKLRAALAQMHPGVVIMGNGIDTNDALKKLSEAIIAIDHRLSAIEGKK